MHADHACTEGICQALKTSQASLHYGSRQQSRLHHRHLLDKLTQFAAEHLLAMNFNLSGDPFGIFIVSVGLILTAVVHLCFACAVWSDAGMMARHHRRGTFLVGGFLWGLATLLGGVFVAGVYWIIHHSTLRPPHPPTTED